MKRYLSILIILIMCFICGKAFSWFWGEDYLAKVNQETIYIEDFQKRLSELHRQGSMQRSKGRAAQIDLRVALEEMIDDYLLYQEGYRSGLDKDPEFIRRSNAYLEFQSILRLRREEIKDNIKVEEDEIKAFYEENYKKSGQEGKTPPNYVKVKGKIKKKIYKTKEKELERQYINKLKENAKIEIYTDVLSSLGNTKKDGKRVVASINGKPVLVSDLEKEYGKSIQGKKEEEAKKIRKKALDGLIEYLLIKEDALNHNYPQEDPPFGKMIAQYRIRLMNFIFNTRIISPQIRVTEEDLKEYYKKNKEKHRLPDRFKLKIISLKDEKEANKLHKELEAGANFNRLARSASDSMQGDNSTNTSWWYNRNLSDPIRSVVEGMKVGDISRVIKDRSFYKIVKLVDLKKGAIINYPKVKGMIKTKLGREKFQSLLNKYLKMMRENSSIKINEDVLKNYEMKVKNERK
ncbi:MAG: peptidyl-prolyl cis-trans isomerase [Spirochaetota bacterium]|nr:peptidyl-prolyl cis-trans isomerase [Spirochaetota bacterium]